MSILDRLRGLFGRAARSDHSPASPADNAFGLDREQAAAWLAAVESGELCIPENPHDVAGWDRYWSAQLQHAGIEQGFNDMMANDPHLIPLLKKRGARTILCAGNGLSSESFTLALHGFDVTVLDLSDVPRAVFAGIVASADHPFRRIPGFTARGEAEVTFEGSGPIDPEQCPSMHKSDDHPPASGGSLRYVTGSLLEPDACPGPFDVVIERRTVQLFKPEERPTAHERLANRLEGKGTFVSHEHQGNWRPGQPDGHYAVDWARQNGFVRHVNAETEAANRVAWLFFSTG